MKIALQNKKYNIRPLKLVSDKYKFGSLNTFLNMILLILQNKFLILKAYKSDDYLLYDDNEKTSILYSYNNYISKLYNDIENAKKIKFYCNYYVKDKMDELLALNNNIEIISDLDIDGRALIKKHSEINAIVIDDEIIWYGSINPFSWTKKDDTIIRFSWYGICKRNF